MKKSILILIVIGSLFNHSVNAQSNENHGNAINAFLKIGYNARVDLSYEIQIVKNVFISPKVIIPLTFDVFDIGVIARADYYFDNLLKLPEKWDIYSGLEAGSIISGDYFSFSVHAGAEYRFHKRWGVIAEIGAGTEITGGVGMAFHI